MTCPRVNTKKIENGDELIERDVLTYRERDRETERRRDRETDSI